MPIHNEHQFFHKHLFQVPLADDTLPFPPFYFLLPIIPLPAITSEGYLSLSVTWNPTPASAPVVDYGSYNNAANFRGEYVFQLQSENCQVSVVNRKWKVCKQNNKTRRPFNRRPTFRQPTGLGGGFLSEQMWTDRGGLGWVQGIPMW